MLKSAYFLPHGMQIIPNADTTGNPKFRILHERMEQITAYFATEEVDTVYLITPHGYNLRRAFVVYGHDIYQAFIYSLRDSVIFGEILDRFEIKGNATVAESLAEEMKNEKIPTEILIHGVPFYPLTLSWGASVCLYYLLHDRDIDYIIVCIPRARHGKMSAILKDLENLAGILSNQGENYSVVVSGDLSHVHKQDGPYGYHPSCKPYDDLVMSWMRALDEKQMKELLEMQPNALACGMAGLYLLQHLLSPGGFVLDQSWYEVPTYFGMGMGRWKLP